MDYNYDSKSVATPRETPAPSPPPNDFETPTESSLSEKTLIQPKRKVESPPPVPARQSTPPPIIQKPVTPPPQPQPEPRSFR